MTTIIEGVRDAAKPIVPLHWHENVRIASRVNRFVYLIGEAGTGKTFFAHQLSREISGHPAQELTADLRTDKVDFWGTRVITDGNTGFQDGPLARAIKLGAVFAINEAGLLPHGMLGPLLELRHATAIYNPITQELLPIPANFRVILTANPTNLSCRQHGEAFQSLIDASVVFMIPDLSEEMVRSLLDENVPDAEENVKEGAIYWWRAFREVAESSSEDERLHLNIRAPEQFMRLVCGGMKPRDAAECTANKFVDKPSQHAAAILRLGLD